MERIPCFGGHLTFDAAMTHISYRQKAIDESPSRIASLYKRRGFKGRLSAKKKRWILREVRRTRSFQEQNLQCFRTIFRNGTYHVPRRLERSYEKAWTHHLKSPQSPHSYAELYRIQYSCGSTKIKGAFKNAPVPKLVLAQFFRKYLPDSRFSDAKQLLGGQSGNLRELSALLNNIMLEFTHKLTAMYDTTTMYESPFERPLEGCEKMVLLKILEHQIEYITDEESALKFHLLVSEFQLDCDPVKNFYQSLSSDLAFTLFCREVKSDPYHYYPSKGEEDSWDALLTPSVLQIVFGDKNTEPHFVGRKYLSHRIIRLMNPYQGGHFKVEQLPKNIRALFSMECLSTI
ncbi:MAG: hypothetical protein MRY21_04775 [Simkaniaceae bacterium]|nr:hypothetical protein [Simkaniaceae bacterium]